jgi:hypothetical protein
MAEPEAEDGEQASVAGCLLGLSALVKPEKESSDDPEDPQTTSTDNR